MPPTHENGAESTVTAQTPPTTLAARIQAARLDAAKKADGGQVGSLLRTLGATETGAMLVDDLRAAGFPEHVISEALADDEHDSRRKARCALGIVADEPVVWLRTSGWQAIGKTGRREQAPSAETVRHAAAPRLVERWLRKTSDQWPVRLEVATGAAVASVTQQIAAVAWARIGMKDTNPIWGELIPQSGNPGVKPDAVLVERWSHDHPFQQAWGRPPIDTAERAEVVLAIEIEDTAKKAALVRRKVMRYEAAVDAGALHGVIWIVRTDAVRQVLIDSGVGEWKRKKHGSLHNYWSGDQFLVPGHLCGLDDAEHLALSGPTWWPLHFAYGENLTQPMNPDQAQAAAQAAPTPFGVAPQQPHGNLRSV